MNEEEVEVYEIKRAYDIGCVKGYQRASKTYKEVINKAIKYIETHKRKDEFLELNEWGTRDLLSILKEVKDK